MRAWFIYMVRCNDGTLYTGITKHISARIKAHNAGTGAKYTRSRLPVVLVYKKRTTSESAARKREAEIKTWTREEKEWFIAKNFNPSEKHW